MGKKSTGVKEAFKGKKTLNEEFYDQCREKFLLSYCAQ